ncbi:hypothetical protein DXG03_006028 [Asterophora parasitica]|uniref:E3 ubiquitin-protein ligase CHFR cysteine rich domain-containing protein n=1 Tax=Asterophora parasitica TaxID=117018 RepID=A0A9P7GB44_9AGAR|nr:hypothetical protein DXG03_006028 [Asterophora parasitica]
MSEPEALQTPAPLIDATTNTPTSREPFSGGFLKRRASSSFEGLGGGASRKRVKDDRNFAGEDLGVSHADLPVIGSTLADDLAQDLQCGCCSELVYQPVLVNPCQHFFCGRMEERIAQHAAASLLSSPHSVPYKRERQQADEIYKLGQSMRIPPPREPSPEANVDPPTDFARPCPHCLAGNPYGWRCPQPIPDPNTDLDHAWHLDEGAPPGHAHCGNCENLLATRAPTTTKCDLCQVFFCGIGVQGRCLAAPLLSQHPHGLSDISDLIQSPDVYDCFENNIIEAEIMFDYLTTQMITPRHIYREIVNHIQSQPRRFQPLMEMELFSDIHGVTPDTDPDPEAPRKNICRQCAAEVFMSGLIEWWIRERQKGFLEGHIMTKKDCQEGRECDRQTDLAHAREFNHMIARPQPQLAASAPPATEPAPAAPTSEAMSVPVPAAVSAPTEAQPTNLWNLFAREAAQEVADQPQP